MSDTGHHHAEQRTPRRYPRVPITAPVEIHSRRTVGAPLVGKMENVSVGGLLAWCHETFDRNTEVAVLFHLPTGQSIQAFGRVMYAGSDNRYGIEFLDLDHGARADLERFTQKMLGYSRRGGRVPYRAHLTIRSPQNPSEEQPAQTVLVSRNGGLLVCNGPFHEGEQVYLWWPDRERGAQARVVFKHAWATDGLVELGFEFLGKERFWDVDFPNEVA